VRLIAPWDGVATLRTLHLDGADIVRMPMPTRGWDRWPSLPALPPLDAIAGEGLYVFPHFGNWPLARSRCITFVHDLAFLLHPETVGGNLQLLQRHTGRWIGRTDIVATVSEFTRLEVQRYLGLSDERTAVVRWGVDTDVFRRRSAAEIRAVRDRYGLPEAYVLHLGNVEPRKNIARLVRAHRLLPATLRRDHPLLLAGGHSWNASEIEAEIRTSELSGDRVWRPTTFVEDEDIPALTSGAALLVQPSLYEGFGLSPLQAMACEVPVLVGLNSAQPEVAGPAAIYVDALDETDIAAGMERALADAGMRSELVTRGLTRAREFTWDRSVQALDAALRRLEHARR